MLGLVFHPDKGGSKEAFIKSQYITLAIFNDNDNEEFKYVIPMRNIESSVLINVKRILNKVPTSSWVNVIKKSPDHDVKVLKRSLRFMIGGPYLRDLDSPVVNYLRAIMATPEDRRTIVLQTYSFLCQNYKHILRLIRQGDQSEGKEIAYQYQNRLVKFLENVFTPAIKGFTRKDRAEGGVKVFLEKVQELIMRAPPGSYLTEPISIKDVLIKVLQRKPSEDIAKNVVNIKAHLNEEVEARMEPTKTDLYWVMASTMGLGTALWLMKQAYPTLRYRLQKIRLISVDDDGDMVAVNLSQQKRAINTLATYLKIKPEGLHVKTRGRYQDIEIPVPRHVKRWVKRHRDTIDLSVFDKFADVLEQRRLLGGAELDRDTGMWTYYIK
jgi:hypothetical protein